VAVILNSWWGSVDNLLKGDLPTATPSKLSFIWHSASEEDPIISASQRLWWPAWLDIISRHSFVRGHSNDNFYHV